ncbi:TBC1 domain family member 23-like [Liolophura sinensis]|uniref:TBC1 domain family member 23-like n=1 Tax=Liolophura sinensis TaxID=3198878 RepID=UPI0031598DE4
MADSEFDESSWVTELETALEDDCDFGTLRNICNGKTIATHLRPQAWQICLNVQGKSNSLAAFDELFDMDNQEVLREDCAALVDKLGNEEQDKVSIVSDLESIITFYCKSCSKEYRSSNGWLDILQPLLALKLSRAELYNCFYAMMTKYVPRDCGKNGKLFHLFRLLLQYHDPELCSFLDTKKITPDMYAQNWFQSLFSANCDLRVIGNMWDVYFQHADPFLVFFLALVILINAREQIISGVGETKQSTIELIETFPAALEADDIEDFCSLAQYYASKTPQSFRREYQVPLFGMSLSACREEAVPVSQALCLPVSVAELVQANQLGSGEGVRYFVVDCRPADHYNAGHLPTAFHLDANLMLQNPVEFRTTVQALCSTQKQAIASGSEAGGEHLCFIGSGREEEDQYVHMVVANFLQKNQQYVSVARGGYIALHSHLKDDIAGGLTDHNPKMCIVCNPDLSAGGASDTENLEEFRTVNGGQGDSLFGKLSSVVKSKSAEMKEKLTNYIKNEQGHTERHVSSSDRLGKRYRNTASVFSIADDDDGDGDDYGLSDEEHKEVVKLDTWYNKPDMVYSCECQEVKANGFMYSSHLIVTRSHLYILRDIPKQNGMAHIQARRALGSIVKITSKKKYPELITFKYGTNEEDGIHVSDMDRFIISKAGEATKAIKYQIIKVLDALDS